MENEDIAEILVDRVHKDLHGKGVLAIPFDLQKCKRKKIWLTISQVDEVTISFRSVSQKLENELVEALKYDR